MRMQYVLKPLALSALAVGLLLVGTPAVQAAQNGDAPQGYKQRGDHDARHADDRGGSRNDRKNGQYHDSDRHNDRQDGRHDRMDRGHDNRSEQGERMGKPQYDKDRGDRRSPRGDEMGRPRDDRRAPRDGQMNQDRRPPRDAQQRAPQGGQRPADNDDDVRN